MNASPFFSNFIVQKPPTILVISFLFVLPNNVCFLVTSSQQQRGVKNTEQQHTRIKKSIIKPQKIFDLILATLFYQQMLNTPFAARPNSPAFNKNKIRDFKKIQNFGHYTFWQDPNTFQQYNQYNLYTSAAPDSLDLSSLIRQYQDRKHSSLESVKVHYVDCVDNPSFCEGYRQIKVFTEHLPALFSQIRSPLPFGYGLRVTFVLLRKAQILLSRYGPFKITEAQIVINARSEIKLWIHPNLARNDPFEVQIVRSAGIHPEKYMLDSLLEIVWSRTVNSEELEALRIQKYRAEILTFQDAIYFLNSYCVRNGIIIPHNIDLLEFFENPQPRSNGQHITQKGPPFFSTRSFANNNNLRSYRELYSSVSVKSLSRQVPVIKTQNSEPQSVQPVGIYQQQNYMVSQKNKCYKSQLVSGDNLKKLGKCCASGSDKSAHKTQTSKQILHGVQQQVRDSCSSLQKCIDSPRTKNQLHFRDSHNILHSELRSSRNSSKQGFITKSLKFRENGSPYFSAVRRSQTNLKRAQTRYFPSSVEAAKNKYKASTISSSKTQSLSRPSSSEISEFSNKLAGHSLHTKNITQSRKMDLQHSWYLKRQIEGTTGQIQANRDCAKSLAMTMSQDSNTLISCSNKGAMLKSCQERTQLMPIQDQSNDFGRTDKGRQLLSGRTMVNLVNSIICDDKKSASNTQTHTQQTRSSLDTQKQFIFKSEGTTTKISSQTGQSASQTATFNRIALFNANSNNQLSSLQNCKQLTESIVHHQESPIHRKDPELEKRLEHFRNNTLFNAFAKSLSKSQILKQETEYEENCSRMHSTPTLSVTPQEDEYSPVLEHLENVSSANPLLSLVSDRSPMVSSVQHFFRENKLDYEKYQELLKTKGLESSQNLKMSISLEELGGLPLAETRTPTALVESRLDKFVKRQISHSILQNQFKTEGLGLLLGEPRVSAEIKNSIIMHIPMHEAIQEAVESETQ